MAAVPQPPGNRDAPATDLAAAVGRRPHARRADAADRALGPREKLELLCDGGSIHTIRSHVASERADGRSQAGDGVIGASAVVAGRPVFAYAEDGGFAGGSLGQAHAKTITQVMELAGEARVPVIGFIESAGARMQEGAGALAGYARVFRRTVQLSGKVPQISIVSGAAAGGGCYSPALTDFVLMTRSAAMFLTGPQVVREVTGEQVSVEQLGGPAVHKRNGVCHLVADDEAHAARLVHELLSYLPQNAWEPPPRVPSERPPSANPGTAIPRESRRVYDVRDVARGLVDAGRVFELSPNWARNVVTAFARIDGRSVGVVANQPRYLGGIIDSDGAQKAARFVRTCNLFNVPLVVLVDTPGFMPGTRHESQGIIRHGAKLLYAFAEATVPKLTVVLRHAYGGGFISMNSEELGADLTFAWPRAKIGIMGPQQAVGIIHRRRIAAAEDPPAERAGLAQAYADEQVSWAAARDGIVDEIVLPAETRGRLSSALTALEAKRGPAGRLGNIPL